MKNMQSNRNGIQKMPPQDIAKDLAGNPKLKILDVRSPVDFGSAYIEGSINIPLESLAARASELIKPGNDYVVVCRMGNKAVTAADILHRSGAECVMVMEGGITRWQKDKLPVIKGKTGISLERQTRMIAGSMVVFGVLMGLLSHWAFSLVALFAGCGLVFAGVTDNCLMGVLLMKLPYNKKLYGASSGCAGACSTTCG